MRNRPAVCDTPFNVVLACAVLLLAYTVTAAPTLDSTEDAAVLQQRVLRLQAEVQELRQTSALLHGGAAVLPQQGLLAMPVGQPFIPSTANIQRTLATRATLWPHYWSFQNAVAADNKVTVSHVLTDRPQGAGNPVYTVLGDAGGWLIFFTVEGHLVFEHDTGCGCAVTALASTLMRSNTTQLAVGLQDGTILLLALTHESVRVPDGSGVTNATLLMKSTAADRVGGTDNATLGATQSDLGYPIRHLFFTKSQQRKVLMSVDGSGHVVAQTQNTGRVLLARRLNASPLAVNLNNDFQMVVQTPHAAFIILMHRGRSSIQRPCTGLAQPQKSNAQHKVGSIDGLSAAKHSSSSSDDKVADQHSPAGAAAVEVEADDSNVLVAAAFDAVRHHRVYGVTAGGDLVALGVPSAQKTNLCKVTQRIPLGLPPGPVRLISSKGRLILLHAAGVAAFDVSTQQQPLKLAGRHLASHTWSDMWKLYGLDWQQQQQRQQLWERQEPPTETQKLQQQQLGANESVQQGVAGNVILHTSADSSATPLAAAAAATLLLLPLGDKAVAAFSSGPSSGMRSSAAANEGLGSGSYSGAYEGSSVDWVKLLQPLIVVMMVVVAVWQFLRASNKNAHLRSRRRDHDDLFGRSGFSKTSFEGLGPGDLGQLGLSPEGFAGSGGLSGLSRGFDDFSDRVGSRDSRHSATRMDDGLLDMGYGGLNAVNARRRARQVLHGRDGRQQQQQQRGVGRPHGAGVSSDRVLATRRQQQQQGGGIQRGVRRQQQQQQLPQVNGSDLERSNVDLSDGTHGDHQGLDAAGTALDPAQKRVRFEDLGDYDPDGDDHDRHLDLHEAHQHLNDDLEQAKTDSSRSATQEHPVQGGEPTAEEYLEQLQGPAAAAAAVAAEESGMVDTSSNVMQQSEVEEDDNSTQQLITS